MKVIVDRNRCQGHALCAFSAPDVYVLDDEGYNNMGAFTVETSQEEAARRGAASCPEGAIEIVQA